MWHFAIWEEKKGKNKSLQFLQFPNFSSLRRQNKSASGSADWFSCNLTGDGDERTEAPDALAGFHSLISSGSQTQRKVFQKRPNQFFLCGKNKQTNPNR